MAINFSQVNSITIGEPYDAEVEYLNFTGTQNIVVPNTGSIDIDIQMSGSSKIICAVGSATRYRKFWVDATGHYAINGSTSGDGAFAELGSQRVTAQVRVATSSNFYMRAVINGIEKQCAANRASSSSTLTFFGNSTFGFGTGKLYGVQGYKVVRVGTAGALYSEETGAIIYPSATVTCGPDTRVIVRQTPLAILDEIGRVLWRKPTSLKTINLNGLSIPGFTCSLAGLKECSICFWARNLADLYHCPSWAESGSWGGTYVGVNGSTIEARFGTGNSNSKKQWTYTQPANEWHHFAAVRNGTTGYYYLYIDGVLVSSQTGGTIAMTNSSSTFMLAQGFNGSTVNTDESIVAYCVFSKALSAEEVVAVKNSIIIDTSKAPFNSNLLLGLNLTEGSGNVLHNVADGSTVTIGTTPTWNVDFPPSQAFSLVEYLQSDGNQYIYTGIVPTSNDVIEMDVKLIGTVAGSKYILGSTLGQYNDNPNHWIYVKPNDDSNWLQFWTFSQYFNTVHTSDIRNLNTKILIDLPNQRVTIQNTSVNSTFNTTVGSPGENQPQLKLFGSRACAIYGFKVTRNGVTIGDYQPVRVGTTGFLFDKVSKTLFGNAGTGEFLYGADI